MERGPFDRGQMMPVRSQQVQNLGIREPMPRQGEQRHHRFDQARPSRVVFALQTFEHADEQRGERVAGREFSTSAVRSSIPCALARISSSMV